MSEHLLEKPVCVEWGINFFEIKNGMGFHHPLNFSETLSPVQDMMNDSKVEHCVKRLIREGQTLGIGC
jgi:hypothetical protein